MKIEHFMKKNESIVKAYSFLKKLNGIILLGKIKVTSIEKNWSGDDFKFTLNVDKGKILASHIDGIVNFRENMTELNFSFPLTLREEEEKIKELLISKFKEMLTT